MELSTNEERMIAPCGVNCTYCYSHLKKKKPCPGCRSEDVGKPGHCLVCKIKTCAQDVGVVVCSDCSRYPCTLIKRLDKSYRTRYNESLVLNMKVIHEKGLAYYLDFEKRRLRCPACGGVLSIHYKQCASCGTTVAVPGLE
ncbi:DUF3795 domain-containing protein [Spirochaeta lutea]|uniref:DUF3795 domain-containing protein n=1 Tax=Spirochaeta lutea TaxID=1480694 RepID=A0A098QU05_9SPIO|nr:DUF3795 domain-containing protein [Spirochaeta lutea]KGE70848.1 hypothetical protein DC28_15360 [Spirochaeta lutea]